MEIFDSSETLDHLCRVSGGHIRNLMRLLNNSIVQEINLPITRQSLDKVIKECRNAIIRSISSHEWDLLRRVKETKTITGAEGYQNLIRNMFVYEYRDQMGSWFDVNPIIAESNELNY